MEMVLIVFVELADIEMADGEDVVPVLAPLRVGSPGSCDLDRGGAFVLLVIFVPLIAILVRVVVLLVRCRPLVATC